MNIFINFQADALLICGLRALAPQPRIKKNISDENEAPIPKIIFENTSIDLEKLPKKNTVSE